MTFERLIELLDRKYEWSLTAAAKTLPGGDAEGVPYDDHLAVAIVSMLYYGFDESKTDSEQLLAAQEVFNHIKGAAGALAEGAHFLALNNLSVEQKGTA